jgi:DNA primase
MDQVDEIKKRIDIAEFIGSYLQLKKTGINYSGLCPFHGEKTPSFMVSPERQSYRCFGCGESGDVISFLQKIESLTFPEALKILGDRVGVQVESRPKEQVEREKSAKVKIYEINLIAAKYFKAILWSKQGAQALKYLEGRGLSQETIKKLKIGFAPADDSLAKYFSRHGFGFADLALAGHPERFTYRIMFPIFDRISQVIGFSGRILEDGLPQRVSQNPKYLNTPETAVFHKSQTLYGLNIAKDAIRQKKSVVVVEGQMDVAASHQAKVENVVASSGTALTEQHLSILGRYTPNIIFAFDEDEAGQKAARHAVQMALELSLEPKLISIKQYKDVGELVQNAPGDWPKLLEKAQPPIEWLVKRTFEEENASAKQKKDLVVEALRFISRMQDEIEKAHYVNFLAKTVNVPPISVEKALAKIGAKKPKQEEKITQKSDPEAAVISFLVNYPDEAAGETLPEIKFKDAGWGEVYNQVKICYSDKKNIRDCLKKVVGNLSHDLRGQIDAYAIDWDEKLAENSTAALADFKAICVHLERRVREKLKQDYAAQIAEAESSGDIEQVKKLMRQLQDNLRSS